MRYDIRVSDCDVLKDIGNGKLQNTPYFIETLANNITFNEF